MALIRKIACHENSRMWAYIEYSDENPRQVTILGGKEFATREEAEEWKKGFALDSYQYVEPIELKRKRLANEKLSLLNQLNSIDEQLKALNDKN